MIEKTPYTLLGILPKTILASRTNGTFGFAPIHKANASQNPKSQFFHPFFILLHSVQIQCTGKYLFCPII